MSGSKKVFTTLGSSNHVPEEREAIAKHTGTMEAREIVAGLKNNLERLTGWHD